MAIEAVAHRQVEGALRHGLLGHLSVALRAIHSGANVRGMIELHVFFGGEGVNALPGNLLPALRVGSHLLDLRAVGRDRRVAEHAVLDAGDPGHGPLARAGMTTPAADLSFQVQAVGEGDRLHGNGPPAPEVGERLAKASVCGSEPSRWTRA